MSSKYRFLQYWLLATTAACASGPEPVVQPSSAAEAETAPAEAAQDPASSDPPHAESAPDAPTSPEPTADAPAGRLAFIQCEGERNPMCTKEFRPVCGEVDNGVRCVTTPCNSTEQREFGNACMACAEPKTTGYWPVACAELTTTAP